MKRAALAAIILATLVLIGWANVYDYKVAGNGLIYRINRFTHQVDVAAPGMEWETIREPDHKPSSPATPGRYDDLLK